MNRLDGKVAIVTGGASGLGESDAVLMAAEGAKVIIADINDEGGRRVADAIGGTYVRHDVTSEADWENVIKVALDTYGRLDVLVNNAAMTHTANIEACSLEDFRKVQQVNVESVFLGCKHAIGAMKLNGGTGSIINISSMSAIRGFPDVMAYTASKGAVLSLSRNVATYCLAAGLSIRCNAVMPGTHSTPMQQLSARNRLNEAVTAVADNKRRRIGEPSDIGNTVLFLATDESRNITGQYFTVDGGYSVW